MPHSQKPNEEGISKALEESNTDLDTLFQLIGDLRSSKHFLHEINLNCDDASRIVEAAKSEYLTYERVIERLREIKIQSGILSLEVHKVANLLSWLRNTLQTGRAYEKLK